MGKRQIWTDKEIAFMKFHSEMTINEMSIALNKKASSVRTKCKILGIKFKDDENSRKSREALCWKCKNACGGCSWSRALVPVEGWQATERFFSTKNNEAVRSYTVHKCPEFIREEK